MRYQMTKPDLSENLPLIMSNDERRTIFGVGEILNPHEKIVGLDD